MATRWREHNHPTHDSEPAKHLNINFQHSYNWTILAKDSKHTRSRNTLNNQLKSNKLLCFRSGIKKYIHCKQVFLAFVTAE